jgi:hypothetical protein
MARTHDDDLEREPFTLTLTSEQEDALVQRCVNPSVTLRIRG